MELLARRIIGYYIEAMRKEGTYKNANKYKMKCLFMITYDICITGCSNSKYIKTLK